jgi:hypothetical protein
MIELCRVGDPDDIVTQTLISHWIPDQAGDDTTQSITVHKIIIPIIPRNDKYFIFTLHPVDISPTLPHE